VRCDILEGEPGMFPEPVARVLRKIGGLFGGKRDDTRDTAEPPQGESAWDDLDPTPPDRPPPADRPPAEQPRAEP
jgi:hypothetical protein